jgi:hypothetical protein
MDWLITAGARDRAADGALDAVEISESLVKDSHRCK